LQLLEDLRLTEEAGMVFADASVEEVEAKVDALEALDTVQLREKCNKLGVVPMGDKRKPGVLRQGLRAARGAVQGSSGSSGSSGSCTGRCGSIGSCTGRCGLPPLPRCI
jgi:hypothetical protein